MFGVIAKKAARFALAACASAAVAGAMSAPVAAQATHDITITVTKFKSLDRADELSRGDFFARVTIDGKSQTTAVVSDRAEVKPTDWVLTASVPAGEHKVKLELIDKDLSVDDPIDINRLGNKRDLDFTVDTRSGRIEGFSNSYKTGQTITRAGSETKKAEISFIVRVKK